jgi:hypothetical protein
METVAGGKFALQTVRKDGIRLPTRRLLAILLLGRRY